MSLWDVFKDAHDEALQDSRCSKCSPTYLERGRTGCSGGCIPRKLCERAIESGLDFVLQPRNVIIHADFEASTGKCRFRNAHLACHERTSRGSGARTQVHRLHGDLGWIRGRPNGLRLSQTGCQQQTGWLHVRDQTWNPAPCPGTN